MKKYIDEVDENIKNYWRMLEPEFPEWLYDYIDTPELLKQKYISITCGLFYTDLLHNGFFYSSLDHSVGVALVVWHFTRDKKQTLAGLFHDIATPAFKHCIDFLDGDYETQESTEDLTSQIIAGSKKIMKLLKRDKIKLCEVDNYHLYPIADNDTPRLSADRLEYTMSNALFSYNIAEFKDIQEFYHDLMVGPNEDGENEIMFKTRKTAEKFVKLMAKLSKIYMGDESRYSMQFLADIVRRMGEAKMLTREDLYKLKESEVIAMIEGSAYGEAYDKWKTAKSLNVATTQPEDVYTVNINVKKRYIDPLAEGGRMSAVCEAAKEDIDSVLNYDMNKYLYLDFKI